MKTVVLVAKREYACKMYQKQLEEIFGDRLRLRYYIHAEEGVEFDPGSGVGQADIVLITNPYSFPWARRVMKEGAQIINVDFTFQKEKVDQLRKLPVGTQVLACFNYYSAAHQAVNTLYEAGLANLNLYIHYPGNRNLIGQKMDLVIIGGHTDEIPPDIPEIFDMGERMIALNTVLELAIAADIMDDEMQRRIIQYGDRVCVPDDYVSAIYNDSVTANLQFRAIAECIDYGIVAFNNDHRIMNYNAIFAQRFGRRGELKGRRVEELGWEPELERMALSTGEFRNALYVQQGSGRTYLVSKEKINKGDERTDLSMLLFKDETQLHNLETALQQQIARRGHVAKYRFTDIKGASASMTDCIKKAKRIALIDKPTLIIGESGTGKELFAQSIHNASSRRNYPFVAMNCAAIPSTLLESELFGYEEGAFTGARKGGKAGMFQMAQKGTLFLDEIGELSLPTQAKLLRVLEEKEIMKVGGGEIIGVDVRIIAATNQNLNELVERGEFRLDLYYRLNTLIINVPPLRERREDIPLLIEEFLRQEELGPVTFEPEVRTFLMNYEWRGNIRELRNCVEYMANIADGHITIDYLPDYIRGELGASSPPPPVPEAPAEPVAELPADALAVLRVLKRRPEGRRGILEALAQDQMAVSEYHLRALLDQLRQEGYLTFGRGRAGCALTQRGAALLERMEPGGS